MKCQGQACLPSHLRLGNQRTSAPLEHLDLGPWSRAKHGCRAPSPCCLLSCIYACRGGFLSGTSRLERWSWIAGIVGCLLTILGIVLNLFQPSNPSQQKSSGVQPSTTSRISQDETKTQPLPPIREFRDLVLEAGFWTQEKDRTCTPGRLSRAAVCGPYKKVRVLSTTCVECQLFITTHDARNKSCDGISPPYYQTRVGTELSLNENQSMCLKSKPGDTRTSFPDQLVTLEGN